MSWTCMECGQRGHVETLAATCGQRMEASCMVCGQYTQWEYNPTDIFHVAVAPSPAVSHQPQQQQQQHNQFTDTMAENVRLRRELDRAQHGSGGGITLPTANQITQMGEAELIALVSGVGDMLVAVQQRMRDLNACAVCFVKPKTVVFFPCKHRAVCVDCAKSLTTCCICRAPISDSINS
eukprot:PhF_6_TR33792/c0_g1_i1/m.49559